MTESDRTKEDRELPSDEKMRELAPDEATVVGKADKAKEGKAKDDKVKKS